MIFDRKENIDRYLVIPKEIRRSIKGEDNVFGVENVKLIDRFYKEKPTIWECHKLYADLHYVLSGTEIIRFSLSNDALIGKGYNSSNDSIITSDSIMEYSELCLHAGEFVFIYPGEIHQTSIPFSDVSHVLKRIYKIRIL